ncbi:hypothetical protein [Salsuginibacillus kocurii]|uniref:hypothetical protein n=1 Tax=Salsuginibacillus kocurii TaxID=427078 RepID=UPI00036EB607|nr:hypothetical protein [Salsuginibacillus kocurii]
MHKKRYYVHLNPTTMEDLTETEVNDPDIIQYAVDATPEEADKLRELLEKTQRHDLELTNLMTFRHFDERIEENDRYEYKDSFEHVLHAIYDLGTPETKEAVKSMHWFPDE